MSNILLKKIPVDRFEINKLNFSNEWEQFYDEIDFNIIAIDIEDNKGEILGFSQEADEKQEEGEFFGEFYLKLDQWTSSVKPVAYTGIGKISISTVGERGGWVKDGRKKSLIKISLDLEQGYKITDKTNFVYKRYNSVYGVDNMIQATLRSPRFYSDNAIVKDLRPTSQGEGSSPKLYDSTRTDIVAIMWKSNKSLDVRIGYKRIWTATPSTTEIMDSMMIFDLNTSRYYFHNIPSDVEILTEYCYGQYPDNVDISLFMNNTEASVVFFMKEDYLTKITLHYNAELSIS